MQSKDVTIEGYRFSIEASEALVRWRWSNDRSRYHGYSEWMSPLEASKDMEKFLHDRRTEIASLEWIENYLSGAANYEEGWGNWLSVSYQPHPDNNGDNDDKFTITINSEEQPCKVNGREKTNLSFTIVGNWELQGFIQGVATMVGRYNDTISKESQ